MTPFIPAGFKIPGYCTVARDIYRNEEVRVEDFTDWLIPVPSPGDLIDPMIQVYLHQGAKLDE